MAILEDEIFKGCDRALDFETARTRILATAPSVRPTTLPLAQAHGHTLAAPVIAARDNPAAALSAMDGYAVAHNDLKIAPLKIDGQTAAGDPAGPPLAPGTARRIFTGGLLPVGADTILIQEDAQVRDGQLHPEQIPETGAFIRPQGFDYRCGDILLDAGHVLSAQSLSFAASANLADMVIAAPPKVALLSTGDELRGLGQAVLPQDVVASNGLALAALLGSQGARVEDLGTVRDDLDAICAAIDQARDPARGADLLITTGGASVGAFDLVQSALARLGGVPDFWQIMMRPGKPVFLWTLGQLTVLGLPGNPVSAFVCAKLLTVPWVRKSLGQSDVFDAQGPYTLGSSLPPNGPRRQFARAALIDGRLVPARSQDSSLLKALNSASVLIDRPPHDPAKTEGEQVRGIPL